MYKLSFIVCGFILWRCLSDWRAKWYWKCLAALPAVFFSFGFPISYLIWGGKRFAPAAPQWWHYFFTSGFALTAFFFAGLVVIEAVRLGFWVCRREHNRRVRRSFRIAQISWLAIAIALCTAGVICGLREPRLCEVEVALPGLPARLDGFRVAVLSDLHIDRYTRREDVRRIVERINALQADLVVLPGDTIDCDLETAAEAAKELENLKSRCGAAAVHGNHEYLHGIHQTKKWSEYLLVNQSRRLSCGLHVAGLADKMAERKHAEKPDIDKTLRDIPPDEPVILLCHRPAEADGAARYPNVILQVSGHTHGGLIWGFHRFVALFNSGMTAGLYRRDGRAVYVSRGAGLWRGFPLRLGIPGEITLLTLRAPIPKKN